MIIGIDGQFLGDRSRGPGVYTENLFKYLKKIDLESQYFVFDKNNYGWKRQLLLPFKLRKKRLDLMHFTHFNVPIFYKGKFVITIHDLNFSNVNFFKKIIYRILSKSALKRAKKIIAISNFTKNEILKRYNINPNKIKVIYEGVR